MRKSSKKKVWFTRNSDKQQKQGSLISFQQYGYEYNVTVKKKVLMGYKAKNKRSHMELKFQTIPTKPRARKGRRS